MSNRILTVAIHDERKAELETANRMIWQYCKKEGVPVEISCYHNEQDFFRNVSSCDFRAVFVAVRGAEDFHTAWRVRDYDKDCMLILVAEDGEFALMAYRLGGAQYLIRPLSDEKIAKAVTAAREANLKNNQEVTENEIITK